MATVVDGDTPAQTTILCDGDTEIVTAASLIGALPLNTRVYVDIVPPSALFIVGLVSSNENPLLFGASSLNQDATAGTTTSATFVNLPGAPTVTFTKAYVNTRIFVNFHLTLQSTLANTSVRCAVNITSVGDGDIAGIVINPASTHTQISGTALFPAAVSGTVTVVGRWRRVAGGGTLTLGTDDRVSISALEVG